MFITLRSSGSSLESGPIGVEGLLLFRLFGPKIALNLVINILLVRLVSLFLLFGLCRAHQGSLSSQQGWCFSMFFYTPHGVKTYRQAAAFVQGTIAVILYRRHLNFPHLHQKKTNFQSPMA